MRIIVIAEESEKALIEKYVEENEDDKVLISGVGMLNVMRSLHSIPMDTPILNIGYAGSANFEVGTVAIVTESLLNHPNVKFDEPRLLLCTEDMPLKQGVTTIKAPCYTNCDFVLASPYKDCLFDMELAAILGMGFTNVRAIKVVSDNLSLHDYRQETGSKAL